MPQVIYNQCLANGIAVVAESMPHLESVAFSLLLPAGAAYDPHDRLGLSSVTCDMLLRGAGSRDSRRFMEELDRLGIERGESVNGAHVSFSAATLAENLHGALDLYADLIRRPHLPEDQLEAARQVVLQELRSVDDEPSHKTMLELRKHYYPEPWNRASHGNLPGLESITSADVGRFHKTIFRPRGMIIGIAGRIDWPPLLDKIENLFGDWRGDEIAEPAYGKRGPRVTHLRQETNQTQIGIAYQSIPYKHPDYFQAWGAVGVLSGGMSSRLFTEVREKRGLCYSVSASLHTLRDLGSVFCHAGTSAERSQETLDVTIQELKRIAEGIEPQELDRLKARIKSSLIMQQESSSSRAGAIARDWYHLGRVRPMEEVSRIIDALSPETINAYLRRDPPRDFTVVTLGPEPLEVPFEVS